MTAMNAAHFCLVGRFLSFLPGEKSPYQKISLAAALRGDTGNLLLAPMLSTDGSVTHQILLSKDLQRMMYRYLAPQDWIRVVAKEALDRRSGQMEWKATEISKLSFSQVDELRRTAVLAKPNKIAKPVRVLICQESSCRQKGSVAVSEAITGAIAQAGCSKTVIVQTTGCMKRCKVGPNVVMLPGGFHSQATPESGVSLIQALSAND